MKAKISFLVMGFVATAALSCGSGDKHKRLKVREGYTTPQVIAAFERRYTVGQVETKTPLVRVEGSDKGYKTITAAAADAPAGATVIVPSGVFRESVVISARKNLVIRGAGRNKSIVLAQETAVYLSRSNATISELGLWSRTTGPDVAVVAVSESSLRLSDCKISGGTGAGVVIAGKSSDVKLVGNLVTGNMGGGVRVQGGKVDMLRNVITFNAAGGVVVAPAAPGAIFRLSLWHDTVLENWSGFRCVSFAKGGVVPVTPLAPYRIEASIINSAGIGETFDEQFFAAVKNEGNNFLSVSAQPAEKFFLDPGADDYRPRGQIVVDGLGIELGAYPSIQGLRELTRNLNNAVVSEKLQAAYLLSLFLPAEERAKTHERIKQVLYAWVDDFLKHKRLGTRLFEALGLVKHVPAEWRIGVILERFLSGYLGKYQYTLKPLNFFDADPQLGTAITDYLAGKTSLFPRFIATEGATANSYVLSGLVKVPFVTSEKATAFKIPRSVRNPLRKRIEGTITMIESRATENERKISDLEYTLTNPHFYPKAKKNSRYRTGMEKKLARLKEDKAENDAKLKALKEQLEVTEDVFQIEITGTIKDTTVSGEISIQLVAAPSGDILLDETQPVTFLHTAVHVDPLEKFNFPGSVLTGARRTPNELAAKKIADMMLTSVISGETANLKWLLEKFAGGIITNAEEDSLVELLLLNADLYRQSLDARKEYRELIKTRAGSSAAIDVTVSYDKSRGLGRKGIVIDVKYNDSAAASERMDLLKSIHRPYWELQEMVEGFLKIRFGLTRKLFLEARKTLDDMLEK